MVQNKVTLVIGASHKTNRFSNIAVRNLVMHKYPVIAIGLKEGSIYGIMISKPFPEISEVHTVTMYINPKLQPEYYDYIVGINPQRVIFNPGTENEEFAKILVGNGIEVVEECTLVMLANGTY